MKTYSHRNPEIHRVVKILGKQSTAARALGASQSTVSRLVRGLVPLDGTTLELCRAILRHPDEYMHCVRKMGPKGPEDVGNSAGERREAPGGESSAGPEPRGRGTRSRG